MPVWTALSLQYRSQERMAIVVDPKDVDRVLGYAEEENLEAVVVAQVTVVKDWSCSGGQEIVNISRAFLDTNGAHQEASAYVTLPDTEKIILKTELFCLMKRTVLRINGLRSYLILIYALKGISRDV